MSKIEIVASQVGLSCKKGKITKILKNGSYRTFGRKIYVMDCDKSVEGQTPFSQLDLNKFQNELLVVRVEDGKVALHYVDGLFKEVLTSGQYTFMKDPYQHQFTMLDFQKDCLLDGIPVDIQKKLYQQNSVLFGYKVIPQGKIGYIYDQGKLIKSIPEGTHYFLDGMKTLSWYLLPVERQIMSIIGQEMLSKDKVTLRFNLVLEYQIENPQLVIETYADYEEQLRLTMQMMYRDYIGKKTLDEILAEKDGIAQEVFDKLKQKEKEFGMKFFSSGIKDIILPGEIRDILNTVLIAEKKALANVITRREETASTRSLLNTAKLMDENETLYRLKELEYLEKIFDKVQTLSLSGSSSLLEQISNILPKKDKEK